MKKQREASVKLRAFIKRHVIKQVRSKIAELEKYNAQLLSEMSTMEEKLYDRPVEDTAVKEICQA